MTNPMTIQLCPAQQCVLESIRKGLRIGSIFRVWGGVGRGKTTLLQELHKEAGGAFLSMKDFVTVSSARHPLALEELASRF
jgi:hypothetical protein